jgi:hypothetical protein
MNPGRFARRQPRADPWPAVPAGAWRRCFRASRARAAACFLQVVPLGEVLLPRFGARRGPAGIEALIVGVEGELLIALQLLEQLLRFLPAAARRRAGTLTRRRLAGIGRRGLLRFTGLGALPAPGAWRLRFAAACRRRVLPGTRPSLLLAFAAGVGELLIDARQAVTQLARLGQLLRKLPRLVAVAVGRRKTIAHTVQRPRQLLKIGAVVRAASLTASCGVAHPLRQPFLVELAHRVGQRRAVLHRCSFRLFELLHAFFETLRPSGQTLLLRASPSRVIGRRRGVLLLRSACARRRRRACPGRG